MRLAYRTLSMVFAGSIPFVPAPTSRTNADTRVAAAQVRGFQSLPHRIQLGAVLADVPDSLRAVGAPAGVLVLSVIAGTSAEHAGIKVRDVITTLGRDSVQNLSAALAILRETPAREPVDRTAQSMQRKSRCAYRPLIASESSAAIVALALAASGMYGVLAGTVADQARLIGSFGSKCRCRVSGVSSLSVEKSADERVHVIERRVPVGFTWFVDGLMSGAIGVRR
jgi:hypothetical protein